MEKTVQVLMFLCSALFPFAIAAASAQAVPINAPITGEIERITLNDPTDVYSGGVIVVGGQNVILPKNLLIDLPANRLSLQQLFAQAPAACKVNSESGLAKADRCNASGAGGIATISAVRTNAGNVIAGDVFIQKGIEVLDGQVTYIDYTDGWFRVNGAPGDPATGVMVRLNDPTGRHTVQQGAGCVAGNLNCSADQRFGLDPDNYVIAFFTGYPVCIPSTVQRTFNDLLGLGTTTAKSAVDGTGDALCPDTNRTNAAVEPPVADSRRFAPLKVGDSVTAEGNFEAIGGARFLSVHTLRVGKSLTTRNDSTQPDYLFIDEAFMDAPGFQNQRARALIIGFTTLAPTDVDFWTIHRNPSANRAHEFPLASIQGCDAAAGVGSCSNQGIGAGGANIFKINYDVDFIRAALGNPPGGARADLSPCDQLRNSPRFRLSTPDICPGGATFANNFGILSPIPHEIQARTGHSLDHPGLITLDVKGERATNGQYLFPFGINLGGIDVPFFAEIDGNRFSTPAIFEGIPWNLDRRLSPSGCLKSGGCEATPQPLDPFPFTGLDPRNQADFAIAGVVGGTPNGPYADPSFTNSALPSARDRILSYVSGDPFNGGKFNFDGTNTILPYALGTFPNDPPLIPTAPATPPNLFAPEAFDDTAATGKGVPVTIAVLANDVAAMGVIDPATVKIVVTPANGSLTVNPDGSVTYLPVATFSGKDVFTYSVASNFGAVSKAATVSVFVGGTADVPFIITAAVSAGSPPGSGTITPRGGILAPSGASQTFTITPNPGFHVEDVAVNGVSKGAVTSLLLPPVSANVTVMATFAVNAYTVTTEAGAGGVITGAATANQGDTPTYTIAPDPGFHIVGVTVNGVFKGAVTSVTLPPVTANAKVAAAFAINTYAISAAGDAKGAVSPAGNVAVSHGASQTFSFTPNAGYSVVNVVVDGVSQGAIPSYTYTGVTSGNHTVVAIFIPDGDLDNDGRVDSADALKALRIAVGLAPSDATALLHGDLAPLGAGGIPLPDRQLTVADSLMILRKAVGLTVGW
jgi:Bacterial Ig domain/Divergent InlB B-repeat domain